MDIQPLNTSNYKNSEYFLSNLQIFEEQLQPILDDFLKYYVFYNKNPDVTEYRQIFFNLKSNLNNINSKLFTLTNEVDSNIESISKNLNTLNDKIMDLKSKNTSLKKKVGSVEEKNNSSTELIYDYKQMYDNNYLRNWALLFSILGTLIILKIMYTKNSLVQPPIK
jgi:uncharacterized protein YdcH (DUF465 family)